MVHERVKDEKYGDFDIDFTVRQHPRRVFATISQWSDRSDNPRVAEETTSGKTKKEAFDAMKEKIDAINGRGGDIFLYQQDGYDDMIYDRMKDERAEKEWDEEEKRRK